MIVKKKKFSDRLANGLLVWTILSIVLVPLFWREVWKRGDQIKELEKKIALKDADLREAQFDLDEMKGTPIEYFMLYRKATLARFELIEPRWDRIMEASWRAARKNGVAPDVFIGVVELESFFNPNAIGTRGEQGLAQVYAPAWPQFDTSRGFEIEYNLDFGAMIFASCMKQAKGNIREALRLYNGRGELPEGMIPYPDRVLAGRTMKERRDK
jgi:soluble lytic murein transglycosylase-like protein